jgi:hypothetical protein
MNILDRIYYKYNKDAVDEGARCLKRLPVKKFITLYLQTLVKRHDNFQILKENAEYADVLSWKDNKKYLFRYHKCQVVFNSQYEEFITLIERHGTANAFYITCGVFDGKIYTSHKDGKIISKYNIQLIDCFHLVKRFLGLKRKWININSNEDILDTYAP